jgi:predicted transcriptional regulator of viral defense system
MHAGIAMKHETNALPTRRARLAAVLRAAKEVVSVDIASQTLGIERRASAKLLSRWKQQGWLRRIGHGLYVPVPLELASSEQVLSDPWVLVPTLFNQCYIGDWSAAHHWELTEQSNPQHVASCAILNDLRGVWQSPRS